MRLSNDVRPLREEMLDLLRERRDRTEAQRLDREQKIREH